MDEDVNKADDVAGSEAERDGDDWDDWDGEDQWSDGSPGGGTDSRLIAVVVVAAVAIIAAILFTRGGSDSTAAKVDPQEQDAAGEDQGETEEEQGIPDWPFALGGQGQSLEAPGFHIWSDYEGMHLRSNHENELRVIVTADDPIVVKAAGGGVDTSTDEGTEIILTIPGGGDGADGPDLDVSGWVSEFTVEVRDGDAPLDTERFHVGDSSTATSNPATFRRGE